LINKQQTHFGTPLLNFIFDILKPLFKKNKKDFIMIPRLALLFLIPLIISSNFYAKEQIFFMPKEAKYALKTFCNDLKFAKKSIKATIYSFTNKKISKALKKPQKKE